MTRRERMEAKVERRREWAEGRRAKASGLLARNEPLRGDWAFNTQPGHIPERARVIAREDRAIEHHDMAVHHESRADGLERQLETSIYSDDTDAAGQCEAKAAALDAEADLEVAVNKAWRKHKDDVPALLAAWQALGLTDAKMQAHVRTMTLSPYLKGPCFPTNDRANARRYRERAVEIRRQAARHAEAEAAPGGIVISRHPEYDYCSVRFAEKPEREILDALRAAGFGWSAGSWSGPTSRLPESIARLQETAS